MKRAIATLTGRSVSLSGLALGIGLALLSGPANAQRSNAPIACADLASQSFPNTTIASAEAVAAGALELPAGPFGPPPDYSHLPAFCRVVGSIHPTDDSDILFELWLPTVENWNGRFMQTGNGGAAGSIVVGSLPDPMSQGYAVANTDTGHQGAMGGFEWAVGHPEKLVDFQYRAVRELTVVGKAITAARYGRAADQSYWVGCSTGGRQGLKEAQRFPEDYDAIVAGAPANNWPALQGQSSQIQKEMAALSPPKLGMLKEGAIAACDALDGVTDRVISEPAQCTFDPADLQCATGEAGQCLSPAEVQAAQTIYRGVVTRDGEVLAPGTGVASEPAWFAYSGPFAIGTSWFRHIVLDDPDWDPADFDADTHVALAEAQDQGAAKAMNPDLSAFIERGGKLLMYHGTTDGLIPYGNTVNYYESVVETIGEGTADESVRLFLVPGMDHCEGGEGAFAVDWLGALETWVETDDAPDELPAARPANVPGFPGAPPQPSRPFTRPVCAYPAVATYTGSGDPNDAANFDCR